ncbi:putative disease resistance protein RGA3 isoform X2 [Vitis riparia]|uniref:putative disease resistance protein RGA3 isoform X1 n=1 Tax=Vitis riparia TaxID=96939 RepID=UPI00155A31BD|nr:putative disease resistance protein RGA3 isoform X1 [Vitis riparia]XP_034703029.1 putative disease resistance protein RGA3 isoform X2 [Vitis riparia]XP_034703030.1 putative disease resistance protein RGA3 isoform X2 [Vitis riparia]XP_034703033.1 putative disease resistance protein RGA3 isoform X2 [Vitis riparia]XP_034703034.1 putative disease resistance protein RGA3 isoform X2 [Vitis riparia]
MAEQIPFSLIEKLLMTLGSSIYGEIGLMYGVRNELGKLQDKLSMIKAVLVDAEEQQQRSHAVATWVQRLKDVVYDADDLFDDFATEELRRKTDVQGRFAGQVGDFFSSSNHLAFRFKMGHRIKDIRERLDDIANETSKFNFISSDISNVPVRNRGRETCSVVEKSHKIVGRDENKREIIELLMQSSTQENLSMVVIVGMGGLGKTTLAQLVYNDQGVVSYFNLKMWVCVSDDFDVKVLVRNIIKSATNGDVENLELDQLQKRLQEKLDRKRYLLVLDDVWNEDKRKWGQFITLLPVGANGSKILVTTRSTRVASVIGIDSPYIVEGLKDDESWDLFESLAFKKGEEQMHPNLVAIGKEIVKMCKGVPLVIATLGRMLYFKTQESHWLSIKKNKNLVLLGDKNDILPILRLSYDNLPVPLKQCFAYCALFPKDYIIQKKLLVQLWMAQGYLQPSDENIDLEDVGNQYFEDLLSRLLFHKVENKDDNNILSCKVHDLIHDLAQSIVKSEVIIVTDDVKIISQRIHHVSLFTEHNEMLKDLMGKSIRTFFMGDDFVVDHDSSITRLLSSLRGSRVMKMKNVPYKALSSLGKLSHLRYLDLSYGSFENLPNAITRLKHLQTLKLFLCRYLKELPRNMKKLINLRHLEIDLHNKLSYMPRGLGELTNLQTLPLFWVGNDGGESRHKRMGRLNELRFLNNLRGELEIKRLSNARDSEAKEAILEGKQSLECLILDWEGQEATDESEEDESEEAVLVMESLQPHPNLKELFIFYYTGVRFPNWMMNDGLDLLLPNLVRIEISFRSRSQVLPPFGQLPSLKYLELSFLNAVECMMDYPSSAKPFFPSLKTLQLFDLPNLEEWGRRDVAAEQAPSYPYLEDLQLHNIRTELCLHLISVSSSLKSLHICGIEELISLPEGLQHVSTLQTLTISSCSSLATLPDWIGSLTSLSYLSIQHCTELRSLPEEMRSLRHLYALEINGCPYLDERCQMETGEDWPKISHIPNFFLRESRTTIYHLSKEHILLNPCGKWLILVSQVS